MKHFLLILGCLTTTALAQTNTAPLPRPQILPVPPLPPAAPTPSSTPAGKTTPHFDIHDYFHPIPEPGIEDMIKQIIASNMDAKSPYTIVIDENYDRGISAYINQIKSAQTQAEKDSTDFQRLWFEAHYGDPQAQFDLAKRFATGYGTPQDRRKAFLWAFTAARNGHPAAQMGVGIAFVYSKEYADSISSAVAGQNIEGALTTYQSEFQKYFAQGTGVDRDYVKGWVWLRKAKEDKDTFPEILISALEKVMSDDELAQAQTLYSQTLTIPTIRQRTRQQLILTPRAVKMFLHATQPWLETPEYNQ